MCQRKSCKICGDQKSRAATWDLTVPATSCKKTEDLIEVLKPWIKKGVGQLEKGEKTGRLHQQCRITLIKKVWKHDLLEKLERVIPQLKGTSFSLTSKGCMSEPAYSEYCTKGFTRVSDPVDLCPKASELDKDRCYKPPHISDYLDNLWPYQEKIAATYTERKAQRRIINYVVETGGNCRKSTTCGIGELYHGGLIVPVMGNGDKIMNFCCSYFSERKVRETGPILIDLPRTYRHERLEQMYSAIEQIKNGRLWDWRHKTTIWWIDSPVIWVFSNDPPALDALTPDRWRVWKIDPDTHDLVPWKATLQLEDSPSPEKWASPPGGGTPPLVGTLDEHFTKPEVRKVL